MAHLRVYSYRCFSSLTLGELYNVGGIKIVEFNVYLRLFSSFSLSLGFFGIIHEF